MKDATILLKVALTAITLVSTLIFVRVASQGASAALPTLFRTQPTSSGAPYPQQYPIMDAIENRIVQKYQNSTCEQLWQERAQGRNQPKSAQEQEAITLLRNDPQMRTAFISRVAAPIANKMFECGMIP